MPEVLQETYHCFGNLLDYPGPELLSQAQKCISLLEQQDNHEAAAQIGDFVEYAHTTAIGRLEEIYTATFDVSPACFIFAGYLLFGESFKRGKFLVRLQEKYAERGFSRGNELADHLAVMLRFMAILDPNEKLAQDILANCLVPVFEKMNANFENEQSSAPNPYAQVLRAILTTLERTAQAVPAI